MPCDITANAFVQLAGIVDTLVALLDSEYSEIQRLALRVTGMASRANAARDAFCKT